MLNRGVSGGPKEGRKDERSARRDEREKKEETKRRTLPEISLGDVISGLPIVNEKTSSKRRVADESDIELETAIKSKRRSFKLKVRDETA